MSGLMIYIAAKEAGVSLGTSDEKTKQFLKENVVGPFTIREKMETATGIHLPLTAFPAWSKSLRIYEKQ